MEQPEIFYILIQNFQGAVLAELSETAHDADREKRNVIERAITTLRKNGGNAYRDTDEIYRNNDEIRFWLELTEELNEEKGYVVFDALRDLEIPALLKALNDPDFCVRQTAVGTVSERCFDESENEAIAPKVIARRAPYQVLVPALIALLQDSSREVRCSAVTALSILRNPAAVSGLIEVLQNDYPGIRYWAADALGEIGDRAAVPALIVALNDPYPDTREAAARSLQSIPDPSAFAPLCRALQDRHESVRANADSTLRTMGESAALPSLLAAQQDPSSDVRSEIASMLESIRIPRHARTWKQTCLVGYDCCCQ